MDHLHEILKRHWGYDRFRPMQEDIMRSVLDGHDTLALMPTGGGKSLCYQVPALSMDGLCLVISPLIALMKDQVENLRKRNITAYAVYAGMSRKEVMHIFRTVSESNCKFLYVSPERLETGLFKEYLPGLGIRLIAVDEAHCISQWGYDFRPPYLRIAALRKELPRVPVLALTASATPDVQQDICEKLGFSDSRIFRQSFERPNLSYSAFRVGSRIGKIVEVLKNVPGTGIVYCKSRKRTKEISELLKMHQVSADFYHAGLSQEERNRRQEDWIRGKTRVIVCTNAFGMGIDKPDVRTVVHANVPDCLENYYQEAGRAGRDGQKSYAVLLFDDKELMELEASVTMRFPSLQDIRAVYHAIGNFLQVPSGGGAGENFDFDFADFTRKFKLNGRQALYALQALEQDGWLTLNDQVFLPSTAGFTVTKDVLYQFEREQPLLEPVIKTLLRAYEGIFDYPSAISEQQIARMIKKEPDDVKSLLLALHKRGIIEYSPRKETPQLTFLRNRCKSAELTIDQRLYQVRKEKFRQRVEKMVHFVTETAGCRSQYIATYFGDAETKPCGICDNCLHKKNTQLARKEFEDIHERIIRITGKKPVPVQELLEQLKDIRKEKAWIVLEFLQAENKIRIDEENKVTSRTPAS